MRFLRGAILAIIATLGLAAGIVSTAYADEGAGLATTGPEASDGDQGPGDPGLPPD